MNNEKEISRFRENTYKNIDDLDYDTISVNEVHKLSAASVFWYDEFSIKRDFPFLHDHDSIIKFILDNCAFISTPHTIDNPVNQAAPVSSIVDTAYRPPRYGRAVVKPLRNKNQILIGLIDLKGAGIAHELVPNTGYHQSGLLSLQAAILEVIYQKIVERIMNVEKIDVRGVPVYAILNTGITKSNNYHVNDLTALIMRKAHRRESTGDQLALFNSTEASVHRGIENALREYGITSTVDSFEFTIMRDQVGTYSCKYGKTAYPMIKHKHLKQFVAQKDISVDIGSDCTFECLNIQTARAVNDDPLRADMIDFGTFTVRKKFTRPTLLLVQDQPLNWGGAIYPNDTNFVQVNKLKALNTDICKSRTISPDESKDFGLPEDSILDGISYYSHTLARDFQSNQIPIVNSNINQFVDDIFK